jgi:hypothetical protein
MYSVNSSVPSRTAIVDRHAGGKALVHRAQDHRRAAEGHVLVFRSGNGGHIRADGDPLENGLAVRAHFRLQRTKGLVALVDLQRNVIAHDTDAVGGAVRDLDHEPGLGLNEARRPGDGQRGQDHGDSETTHDDFPPRCVRSGRPANNGHSARMTHTSSRIHFK